MPERHRRSILFRRPVSGKDFLTVGLLLLLGAVMGNLVAAWRQEDTMAYLTQTLPLTLAAVIPTAAIVLGAFWYGRRSRSEGARSGAR